MSLPLGAIDDEEGAAVPADMPRVIDAHVHLFPDKLFLAIWRWFETHGWPIRYKLQTPEVLSFLFSRGVSSVVALHYAHKPSIAEGLNAYMAEIARNEPRVLGMATVYPGEDGSKAILERAFAIGLRGVKTHCHVQAVAPDTDRMTPIYEACVAADLPLVMHAGREPSSKAYPVDPYTICSADRTETVLRSYPTLKLCVPHLGADEFDGYIKLLERYDNLWLDTTMMLGKYFSIDTPPRILSVRPERIMYGTDFPNLPYAWDRELRHLGDHGIREEHLAGILGENAKRFFGIS